MAETRTLPPRAAHAMTQIKRNIEDGTWPVGTRIPPEPQLCELLNVGRNTLREAIHSLVHSGMLDKRQGSGTYVLARDELTGTINRHISSDGFRDCLEARRGIEVEAVRLAARRHTTQDAKQLMLLVEQLGNTLGRHDEKTAHLSQDVVDIDVALHRAMVKASKNKLLLSLFDSIQDAVASSVRANIVLSLMEPAPSGDLYDDHAAIVHAIIDRDEDGATLALTRTFEHLSTKVKRRSQTK